MIRVNKSKGKVKGGLYTENLKINTEVGQEGGFYL